MLKRVVFLLLLALVVACTPRQGEWNVKLSCSTMRNLGLEVVNDFEEIGWCTVRGTLPLAVTQLSNTETNGTWGLPTVPIPPVNIAVSDPLFPRQWGLQAIHAPEAWQTETGKPTTVVAVLDTGVDTSHPDIPPVDCISLVGANCLDGHGHGTHVIGIIAMQANAIGGVGVSPGVKILAVKVLNDRGNGSFSVIANGILEATRHGADVINMSFGGLQSSNLVNDALTYAYEHGALPIAACGNNGQSHLGDICLTPANRHNVLSVGAVDEDNRPAPWSNHRADVMAPGVNIISTVLDGQYAAWNGTSMATPHVAAAAALYISSRGDTPPSSLMARIRGTTTIIPRCDIVYCGAGLVNANDLLTRMPRPTPTPPPSPLPPTAYPPPGVTGTPTLFLSPTAAHPATVSRPTLTPRPALTPSATASPSPTRCSVIVNRVAQSDSIDRWWGYVGASFLNFIGRDGELLESYVISLPHGWWSLVISAEDPQRCGAWRTIFEDMQYTVTCSGACPSRPALEAISIINHEREQVGLPPLTYNAALWRSARDRTKKIAAEDKCVHNDEIIGCGFPFPTAASMIRAWLDSPEHHAIIMCTSCTQIGVSYMQDDFWYNVWAGVIH